MFHRSLYSRMRGVVSDPREALLFGVATLVALAALAAATHLLLPSAPPIPTRPAPTPASARVAAHAPMDVARESLGSGETLSQVWERSGRPRSEMAAVVEAATAVFDVRRLRGGTPIELYLRRDVAGRVRAPVAATEGSRPEPRAAAVLDSVLIRVDADRTLAVRPAAGGTFRGELRETPLREVERTYVGCIESSLMGALTTESEDFSALALDLDRIYGGQVDFYSDLQPGDCVTLRFQTLVRPDGTLKLGRIEAAELVNRGTRRPAVWFEAPDGTADYYDLEGRSLKRQFLRSPLKFTRISSGFTMRRFHPILKRYRAHPAIDYAAPAGTPVQAAGNGVVAFAGWKRGYGKVVEIRHGKTYETTYAHLSRIPRGVRAGVRVSQGDLIGYVGSTGLATAPHLDYRFMKNGRFVNPLDESLPTGEPVATQYAALFEERRDEAMIQLAEAYRAVLVDRSDSRAGAPASGVAAAAGALLGTPSPAGAGFGDD